MQLLLVEDDEILATGMASLFRLSGFTVEHAPNGAVAEFLLARQQFDAVILDLGLPLVDGRTVLENLRLAGNNMPVLVLTALDRLDSRIACLASPRSLRASAPNAPRLRKSGKLPLLSRWTRPPS